jgi:hypothetical protein
MAINRELSQFANFVEVDDNTQKIAIDNNVGIGTTNPSEKLHVEGNLRVTGGIYDSSNKK